MKKLIVIIILASVLRFWNLGSFPALNADEAAIGYNAYSLIQTGADEHGNPWPIHFQSFNDFKPGLYFYTVLPFVALFGLNEWTVRVPAAAIGVLTVLVLYFLVKKLFKNQNLALLSSLFLAISPWHIHFSRGGWEVNVALFFITLGVYLFLKAQDKPKIYFYSFLSFASGLYTYHAARIIIPLLGLGLFVLYKKEVFSSFKSFLVSGFLAFLICVPLAISFLGPAGISRASGVGLFADSGPLSRVNEQRGEHADLSGMVSKLFHNKLVNYSLAFLENWSEHFWGEFLFLSGDEIQRNKVPETGQMYMIDFVFILIGLISIIKVLAKSREWKFIFLWLAVAPLAAALTFQSPHALRAHNMVIPLVITSAFGFCTLIKYLKNNINNKTVLATCYLLLATVIAWSFARYQVMYWGHMSKEYPFSSQYGVKELVDFVEQNQDQYGNIVVTDRYDQPYVLFLFYLKYPPKVFQTGHQLTERDEFGFSTVRRFDKYEFVSIKYEEFIRNYPNSLLVGTDEEIPNEANIIKKIHFPNGEIAFEVVSS